MDSFDSATLLPSLRMYLRELNIVRLPSDTGSPYGSLPPLWLDPRKGTPYPGQTEDLGPTETHPDMVLGAYPETGIPSKPFEGFYRQKGVTIYIRSRTSPPIQNIFEHQLYPALSDRRNLDMNGLQVNQSMLFRDLQRISADSNGYVYNCEFIFDLWGQDDELYTN